MEFARGQKNIEIPTLQPSSNLARALAAQAIGQAIFAEESMRLDG
jgi:hypothetical protein